MIVSLMTKRKKTNKMIAQTSLDAGFDLSDQQMDEQLEDSDSLKEKCRKCFAKNKY